MLTSFEQYIIDIITLGLHKGSNIRRYDSILYFIDHHEDLVLEIHPLDFDFECRMKFKCKNEDEVRVLYIPHPHHPLLPTTKIKDYPNYFVPKKKTYERNDEFFISVVDAIRLMLL